MRSILAALLLSGLVACTDGAATVPLPSLGPDKPAADKVPNSFDDEPLRDVLDRIAPTLGRGPAAAALRSALAAVVDHASPAALTAVESALIGFEAEQPDLAVEADVIRLALSAQF
jgi:hypothetical protein